MNPASNSSGNWKLHKRKLHLKLLLRLGKQVPCPEDQDETYQQHEQRFLALLDRVVDIRKSLQQYRQHALPLYCSACAKLGAEVWCVVSADKVGSGTDAEKFRHAMCTIDEKKEMKHHFFNAEAVLAGAERFLDIHINAMRSVQSQLDQRKSVHFEYEWYRQKLARLRSDKKAIASGSLAVRERIERNTVKLEQAQQALHEITCSLYRVFAKYESERDTMLNGELEMVRQVMHDFYARNAEATNFKIQQIPDRSIIEARAEDLYQDMIANTRQRQTNEFRLSIQQHFDEQQQLHLQQVASAAAVPGASAVTTSSSLGAATAIPSIPPSSLPVTANVSVNAIRSPTVPAGTLSSSSSSSPTSSSACTAATSVQSSNQHEPEPLDPNTSHEPQLEDERKQTDEFVDELGSRMVTIRLTQPKIPQVKPFYRHSMKA